MRWEQGCRRKSGSQEEPIKTAWRQVLKDPGLIIRNGYYPESFLNVLQKLVSGWILVVTERMNWGESNWCETRELGGELFPTNVLHIFPHFLEVAIFKNLVRPFPAIACTSKHTKNQFEKHNSDQSHLTCCSEIFFQLISSWLFSVSSQRNLPLSFFIGCSVYHCMDVPNDVATPLLTDI